MNEAGGSDRLRAVLAQTNVVFLDFDGPVCRVYPDDLNLRAADQMRARLSEHGIAIPDSLREERDPLEVLRYAGSLDDASVVDDIDRTLTEIELAAVPEAIATPGAAEFLTACATTERSVVIVSNNATEAIEAYLRLRELSHLVQGVVGRPHARPHEMKPHPHPLESALAIVRRAPEHCVLIGDSITDIQVAKTMGLDSIAYVKAPDRRRRLVEQDPDAIVESMVNLAAELARVCPEGTS